VIKYDSLASLVNSFNNNLSLDKLSLEEQFLFVPLTFTMFNTLLSQQWHITNQ